MSARRKIRVKEHIVEIVSDSGEGAQKAAVSFAEASAMMGNVNGADGCAIRAITCRSTARRILDSQTSS